jgi:hypothetical protein
MRIQARNNSDDVLIERTYPVVAQRDLHTHSSTAPDESQVRLSILVDLSRFFSVDVDRAPKVSLVYEAHCLFLGWPQQRFGRH